MVEEADELKILPTGEELVDRCVLSCQPNERPDGFGILLHKAAGDPGDARIGDDECGQNSDEGRLARPVGPEER